MNSPKTETFNVEELIRGIPGQWRDVAYVWEEFRRKHKYSLRADIDVDRNAFLRKALTLAHEDERLEALLDRLDYQWAGNGDEAGDSGRRRKFVPERYVNGAREPTYVRNGGRWFTRAIDHVCTIAINGVHAGTGVLIRPTVVATAAHVVEALVDSKTQPAVGTADSLRRLTIKFFDADDLLCEGGKPVENVFVASLHSKWLLYFSPQAPSDRDGDETVAGIDQQNGPWDLALIRLNESPRPGLMGHRIREVPLDPIRSGVHVLHHPGLAGQPTDMLWSVGEVTEGLGEPLCVRLHHTANTAGGSSGAPCFNDDWWMVAIHHAGGEGPVAVNRAVPTCAWAQHVDEWTKEKPPTPYLSHVTDPQGTRIPVFGRKSFQDWVWSSMLSPPPSGEPAFVVRGTPASGKSFTVLIVQELARLAGCQAYAIDAQNALADLPGEFIERVKRAMSIPAGDTRVDSSFTSGQRELRNQAVASLADAIEKTTLGKVVWLVIDGLDRLPFTPGGIDHVIDALLAELGRAPSLRLVLIGWQGNWPAKNMDLLESYPAMEDVAEQLFRSLAPSGEKLDPVSMKLFIASIRKHVYNSAGENPYRKAATAVQELALELMPTRTE